MALRRRQRDCPALGSRAGLLFSASLPTCTPLLPILSPPRSELGLTMQDIAWLTAVHDGVDCRWWFFAADLARELAQRHVDRHAGARALGLDAASSRRRCGVAAAAAATATPAPLRCRPPCRHAALLPKTVQLAYICHFVGLMGGRCEETLGCLDRLVCAGVPPHLAHCLALQLAGLGVKRSGINTAGPAPRGPPGVSAADAASRLQELAPAFGGSWAATATACVCMPELLAAGSAEEAGRHMEAHQVGRRPGGRAGDGKGHGYALRHLLHTQAISPWRC